jgi:hypothetical protein
VSAPGDAHVDVRERKRHMFRLFKRAPWVAAGAAVAYYADPSSGITRRRRLRRQVESFVRGDVGATTSSPRLPTDLPPGAHLEGVERRRSEDTVAPIPQPDIAGVIDDRIR